MKKALLLVVAALAIPSVALAAKPSTAPSKTHNVTYVLKGTLSNYTAYDSSSQTNGSITILVAHGNKFAKGLKGQTLTFPVDANTTISLENGVTAIANGDKGIVKVRAPKGSSADQLQAIAAKQIVDQGA